MRFTDRYAAELLRVESDPMRAIMYILEDKSWFVRFFLRSKVKPTILSMDALHRDDADREKRIQAIGGALAEYQNETYSDDHQPGEIAKLATEAFAKLMTEIEQMSGGHKDTLQI